MLISSFTILHVRWRCPTRINLAVTEGCNIAQAGITVQKCVPEERQQCAVELLSGLQSVRPVSGAHLLPPAVVCAPLQWPVITTHCCTLKM